MSQVTLAEAKMHVFAEDYTHDDVIIQGFIDAAEQHVESHLRRNMTTDFPLGWPVAVKQAVKFLLAHFYLHRSATAPSGKVSEELPYAVHALLAPYRNLA